MIIVSQTATTMQKVLTDKANEIGRTSGFIERERKFNGASFVQTLVFGWLNKGDASLSELSQMAAALGIQITESGLDQRFGPKAAALLKELLEAAAQEVLTAEAVSIPILNRFAGVHLQDSSVIGLPASLATIWPGCNSSQGKTAALKVQVVLNFSTGSLDKLWLQAGRAHDLSAGAQALELVAGALRIADLGYFKLDMFQKEAKKGVFWLSRLKISTKVYDPAGQALDLERWLASQPAQQIELAILLGSKHRIPCRLMAVRVPDEMAQERRRRLKRDAQKKGQSLSKKRLALASWTLLITNVPSELLAVQEALILYRVRWQIELLFKLWKSVGQLGHSRSQNPWRILCEIYAKLLALIIQHWVLLTGFWAFPNRSLTKAAHTIQKHAISLAIACQKSKRRLIEALKIIDRCLAAGCRMNPRRSRPNTYQLLLHIG